MSKLQLSQLDQDQTIEEPNEFVNDRKNHLNSLRKFSVPISKEIKGSYVCIDRGVIYFENVPIAVLNGKEGTFVYISENKEDQSTIESIYSLIRKDLDLWIDSLFLKYSLYDLQTHGLVDNVSPELENEQLTKLYHKLRYADHKKSIRPKKVESLEEKLKKEETRLNDRLAKRKASMSLVAQIKTTYKR